MIAPDKGTEGGNIVHFLDSASRKLKMIYPPWRLAGLWFLVLTGKGVRLG